MSEESAPPKLATNDEIIDELTKDLEKQCDTNDSEKQSETKDSENSDDEEKCDDDEQEAKTPEDLEKDDPTVFDDYIDELALKDLEVGLSDEEKEERRKEALELKKRGNEEFNSGDYFKSVETYTQALRLCPLAYESDRAIFYSNRAASKILLERKKSAIDDCTQSIQLNGSYLKAYLRRARLYEETDKLDESLEDWKKILELDPGHKEARAAAMRLPPMINERNEKLKEEMLGKLKDLGNMFLRPFGLSTENFKMQQDPNTGGYSVNFQK